jgi:succinate dehydrogenase / fumarate reductase cytochrome b subunit
MHDQARVRIRAVLKSSHERVEWTLPGKANCISGWAIKFLRGANSMTEPEFGASGIEERRPLSPHLQIYRPMLTMTMSIAHRITGVALYFGTLLLAWFLIAVSVGGGTYDAAAYCLNSIAGKLILFGFTWALFHHLLGGIRHTIWDTGHGLEYPQREWLARATLFGAIVLTVIVWTVAYLGY